MTSSGPGRILLGAFLAMTLVCVAFAAPEESVDFSLCPPAGLKFKVTDEQVIRCSGKLTVGEGDPEQTDLTQTITARESYTQTLVEVAEGAIVSLEREYEDVTQKVVAETPLAGRPQEHEQTAAVAWKHYRARWKDDAFTLEEKDEDTWKSPNEEAKRRLTSHRLRQPMVPLPTGTKKVGETWELDAETLRAYFTDIGEVGRAADRKVDGSARFTLTGFEDLEGDRCAVITFTLRLEIGSDRDSYTFTLEGKIHYSLRHRIPVRMKGEGPLVVKAEGEKLAQGEAMGLDLKGTRTMNRAVKVLAAGAAEKKED